MPVLWTAPAVQGVRTVLDHQVPRLCGKSRFAEKEKMEMKTVPPEIIAAVNNILAPYGETYTPGGASSGFLSPKDAAVYLGVSRSFFFWRLVSSGTLKLVQLTPGSRGKRVISRAALDAYVESRVKTA